jgi:hypothetical protein
MTGVRRPLKNILTHSLGTHLIKHLYPEAEPLKVAEQQVAALVWQIQTECPELIGRLVPQAHLARQGKHNKK